ncbi:hypothetical protein BRDID11002_47840 [Bradyrhizobium diazoefficiens]
MRPAATTIRPDRSAGALEQEFRGWGRAGSDFDSGLVTFETIKPGAITDKAGRKCAPHVNVWIVARGINIGLNTRLYFSDEEAANAGDPVLNLIEQPARRKTLIATRSERAWEGRVFLHGQFAGARGDRVLRRLRVVRPPQGSLHLVAAIDRYAREELR